LGGDGDDDVEGNIGNDVLRGDAGADTFTFDPSREEGADTIADFAAQDGDVIAISAAGLGESGASLEGLSGARSMKARTSTSSRMPMATSRSSIWAER
jgi:Ca2+-binding RTX toxin-like protein